MQPIGMTMKPNKLQHPYFKLFHFFGAFQTQRPTVPYNNALFLALAFHLIFSLTVCVCVCVRCVFFTLNEFRFIDIRKIPTDIACLMMITGCFMASRYDTVDRFYFPISPIQCDVVTARLDSTPEKDLHFLFMKKEHILNEVSINYNLARKGDFLYNTIIRSRQNEIKCPKD